MNDHKLPDFLSDEPPVETGMVFKPEQGRRGEWVAWASALALAIVIALQTQLAGEASAVVIGFFIFVCLAAILITFANWMERSTTITITAAGVHYASPLRKTELHWSQIEEIWLAPSRSSWRISVSGEMGHFNFQTLLTLESVAGSARMGIAGGKQLAAHIIRESGMVHPEYQDGIWIWKRNLE
jgi:hypothetical protein